MRTFEQRPLFNLIKRNLSQTLITQLRNRDQRGLESLYTAYSGSLNGIILRIVKDPMVSEEVLQQTFLKIWNNFQQYDETRSSLFTWMATIARNTSIDKVRLKGFQRNQKTESTDERVYDFGSVSEENHTIDVKKLMSKLEEKYRIVLDKIYLEGFSHGDLAKELDLPLGTVKSRLRIAIGILREELKDEKKLFLGLLFLILLTLIIQYP